LIFWSLLITSHTAVRRQKANPARKKHIISKFGKCLTEMSKIVAAWLTKLKDEQKQH